MIIRGSLGTKKIVVVSSTLFVFGSIDRSVGLSSVRLFVRSFVFYFISSHYFQTTSCVVVGFVPMEKDE